MDLASTLRSVIMKTHTSFPIVLLFSSLAAAGAVQASCQSDGSEIGDIGPGGNVVCAALEGDFPSASIELYDRKIHSATHVAISARVDGSPFFVEYHLEGADWIRSSGPCQAEV
jgi:hypothetical protein